MQFYSSLYRDQKRREFLSLTHKKLSVVEYEATFAKLSKYAIVLVTDEAQRCRIF